MRDLAIQRRFSVGGLRPWIPDKPCTLSGMTGSLICNRHTYARACIHSRSSYGKPDSAGLFAANARITPLDEAISGAV